MGSVLGGIIGTNNTNYTSSGGPGESNQETNDQYLNDLGNKSQIYNQQQNLAQALQQQMAGQGPNPAQTQYLANVQNNIANTQGMIASQRGLNPALAARMGTNAASAANQHAALGSALLQQNQQLGATANLGNLYGQMQSGNLSHLGQADSMAQNANSLNSGVASGNAQRNAGLVGGLLNAGGAMGAAALTPARGPTTFNFGYGAVVPGKAKTSGDSQENDTVHAMLSPGEIVIPRSKAHDPEKAKEFVDHLLKDKKSGGEYKDVLAARRKRKAA